MIGSGGTRGFPQPFYGRGTTNDRRDDRKMAGLRSHAKFAFVEAGLAETDLSMLLDGVTIGAIPFAEMLP